MKRLLALLCVCFFSIASHAATINRVVVFGDSLSDNGNLYALTNYAIPKNPPYFQGRFSNGPIWIETLAKNLGLDVNSKNQFTSYAYAGAWASESPPSGEMALVNLSWEVMEYLDIDAPYGIPSNALMVLWIGGNDYLSGRYDTSPESATSTAIASIETNIQLLIRNGAKQFFILNLPDLGTTPKGTIQGPPFAARLTQMSQLHNQKLAALISKLQKQYANVQFVALDVTPHFNDLLIHPEKHHLTNLKDACYDGDYGSLDGDDHSPYHLCNNPNEYIYWDHIHPSQTIHNELAIIAQALLKENHIERG